MAAMIGGVAQQFKLQYCKTEKDESFLLAVDDELRPGDALAQAEKWDEALKACQDVKMRKNEADRLFSIGAAYDPLLHAEYRRSGSMEEVLKLFRK